MLNYWEKFDAMGTEVVLSALLEEDEEGIIAEAKEFILDFSDRFSRFLPGNELFALNSANGKRIKISPLMREFLIQAKKFHQETGGIFDPTIIGALEEAGYDRDFSLIEKNVSGKRKGSENEKDQAKYFSRVPFDALEVTEEGARSPKGWRIDTGGSGKGFIVDQVARKFFSEVENFWISAGGDIFFSGHREGSLGWEVGVENPLFPEENIFTLKTNGERLGVATSGIIKRKGVKDGQAWHHLIDPRTGKPVNNDIMAVTVMAPDTQTADVLAKTVLILGKESGLELIENRLGTECIIFFQNAKPLISRNMLKYIR